MEREEGDLNSSTIEISQQLPICRVCLESTQPIVTLPCSCLSGNSQIHWECLKRIERFTKHKQCDVCKSKLTYEGIYTDIRRQVSCSCECQVQSYYFRQFAKLAAKLVLFIGGFMLALTPVYIPMAILYTYLCIGVGGLLIFFSIQIEKPDMGYVRNFLTQLVEGFCCCCSYFGIRRCDAKCLWCFKCETWVPTKLTGVRLKSNSKEVVIAI